MMDSIGGLFDFMLIVSLQKVKFDSWFKIVHGINVLPHCLDLSVVQLFIQMFANYKPFQVFSCISQVVNINLMCCYNFNGETPIK